MARFVFVVWGLVPGGTYSVMGHFGAALARRGEVIVVSHGPDRLQVPWPVRSPRGRFSHPLAFPWIWVYFVRVLFGCLAAARDAGGGSVLLPQDSIATGAAAAVAGRLAGVPVVMMEHGASVVIRGDYFWRVRLGRRRLHWLRQPLLRASVWLLHRLCLRLTHGALIPGDEAIPIYRSAGAPEDRILRYHIPVDLDRFRPATASRRARARRRFGLPADRRVVLSVGRLAPEKGVEVILEALAALPEDLDPLLVLAGDGPLRGGLEAAASTHRLDARFLGDLDADAVAELLAAADIFAYGGIEGTNAPVAVLEAMASGIPVVGSTRPAAVGELLDAGRGIAVAPGNVAEAKAALERFLRSAELRATAGARARRYVERHHSPAVFASEVERFIGWLPIATRGSRPVD